MRKFFFTVIFILLLCSCAYSDAALYVGTKNIGAVPIIEAKTGYYVPAEDVGRLLGFSSRGTNDEVLLTRGNASIRVIADSAAAWRGMSIAPLQSPAIKQNGRIWIDSSSAAALFQSSAGQGQANRLRFSKVSGASPTTTALASSSRRDVEFGKFPEQPQPALIIPQIPAVRTAQASPAQQPILAAARTPAKSSGRAQPRHETFRPNDNKKPVHENWSGTIQSIRWTDQEGANRKIRAVIIADDNADPQVYMMGGNLHALFSSSLENAQALASPYTNIKTELKVNAKGTELIFTPSGITRAEKTILNSPRRIVFDFFFPESVKIANISSAPAQTQTAIQLPVPAPMQTPTTAQAQMPAKPSEPVKRAEPIIIINNTNNNQKTPAVRTPPSNITIPMTQTASKGRKVIVIDPGHGGKDPGASANGVTEKNVNLAIGLELERILASQGYRVIMTRRTDVYLQLQERTDIANNANADLFVSVHVNALPSKKSMTGFEIYIMALPTDKDAMNLAKIENREYVEGKGYDVENVDRRTEMLLRILGDMQQNNKISESTDFAASLYNAGARSGLPMRRVAQAPFFVLRGAGMPAVLIETGFVTNATEAQRLNTAAYQNQIARAMAAGISSYLK